MIKPYFVNREWNKRKKYNKILPYIKKSKII